MPIKFEEHQLDEAPSKPVEASVTPEQPQEAPQERSVEAYLRAAATPPKLEAPETPVSNLPEDVLHRIENVDQAGDAAKAVAEAQAAHLEHAKAAPTRIENARERAMRLEAEASEKRKKDFVREVMESRRHKEAPPPAPQPVPRAIAEQTRREMELGKHMNNHYENLKKTRPVIQKSAAELAAEGKNTPVFRPSDYAHEAGNTSKGHTKGNTPVR